MDDTFVIRFRDFEIRKLINNKHDYEIVKYNPDGLTGFTIAWLNWNDREFEFGLESCGIRLMEYYENGLDAFIIKACDLLALCMEGKR